MGVPERERQLPPSGFLWVGDESEQHAGLSPEQRQQMREQMREHWQGAPLEDRDSQRQQRREYRQQLDADERQRMRHEMIQTTPAGFDPRSPGGPPPHHRRRWE